MPHYTHTYILLSLLMKFEKLHDGFFHHGPLSSVLSIKTQQFFVFADKMPTVFYLFCISVSKHKMLAGMYIFNLVHAFKWKINISKCKYMGENKVVFIYLPCFLACSCFFDE